MHFFVVVVDYRDLNSKVLKLKMKATVFLDSPDEIVPNVSIRHTACSVARIVKIM